MLAGVKREIRFQIPHARAGGALLDFVAQRFPYHSAEGWEQRIADGRLLVNGRRTAPGRTLLAGDVLEYDGSDIVEPPVSRNVGVVFDDSDLLVVDKPANLPTHPGGRYFNHTLWAILKTEFGVDDPTFVNRLDRETSGLVVVARHSRAAKACRAQFAARRVEKRYVALVEGAFPGQLHAAGRVAPDTDDVTHKKQRFVPLPPEAATGAEGAGSTWAETDFRRVAACGPVTEVEAAPATGRLHQIRVTLAALGFPVVGDKLYGVVPDAFARFCRDALTAADWDRLRLPRQALHAASLRLRHPRGAELCLEAPLPEDMRELARRLHGAA